MKKARVPELSCVILTYSVAAGCCHSCLDVARSVSDCKNGGTDQDVVSGADLHGLKRPCIRLRYIRAPPSECD